jgi:hypothetical protein
MVVSRAYIFFFVHNRLFIWVMGICQLFGLRMQQGINPLIMLQLFLWQILLWGFWTNTKFLYTLLPAPPISSSGLLLSVLHFRLLPSIFHFVQPPISSSISSSFLLYSSSGCQHASSISDSVLHLFTCSSLPFPFSSALPSSLLPFSSFRSFHSQFLAPSF